MWEVTIAVTIICSALICIVGGMLLDNQEHCLLPPHREPPVEEVDEQPEDELEHPNPSRGDSDQDEEDSEEENSDTSSEDEVEMH